VNSRDVGEEREVPQRRRVCPRRDCVRGHRRRHRLLESRGREGVRLRAG
jgi:hypothetical protein